MSCSAIAVHVCKRADHTPESENTHALHWLSTRKRSEKKLLTRFRIANANFRRIKRRRKRRDRRGIQRHIGNTSARDWRGLQDALGVEWGVRRDQTQTGSNKTRSATEETVRNPSTTLRILARARGPSPPSTTPDGYMHQAFSIDRQLRAWDAACRLESF